MLLAFFRWYFGKIAVEVADGMVFNLLFLGFAQLLAGGQAADAMALKTAVQGRVAQLRNSLLERVETVIKG